MAESYQLHFSDEDLRTYGKLDAAIQDLASASSYGAFILKKGWKAKPWSRGSTYLQQSAFVTAMIVSYCRAFTRSEGWPRLPKEFLDVYSADESHLHTQILDRRHKLYAHSDSVSYGVIPWKSDWHSDIQTHPVFELPHADILSLQTMCRKMVQIIKARMTEMKQAYVALESNDD